MVNQLLTTARMGLSHVNPSTGNDSDNSGIRVLYVTYDAGLNDNALFPSKNIDTSETSHFFVTRYT